MTVQPTRRTFVRAAAWSVPAITVASTAPAFADSTTLAPNLSGTVVPQPQRSGSTISFAPFSIVNSGAVDTQGVALTFTLGTGQITEIKGQYGSIPMQLALDGFGGANNQTISVSARPAGTVTVSFPENFWNDNGNAHANNGAPLSTTVTIFLETTVNGPNTVEVALVSANADPGQAGGGSFSV